MTDKIELNKCYQVIFEALEKGYQLEQVVKLISEGLGIPIIVLDFCGSILTSTYTESYGIAPESIAEEKETWVHMMEMYYSGEQETGKDTIVTQIEASKQRIAVMSSILVEDNMVGFCITYHCKENGDENISEINRLVCRALSIRAGCRDSVYSSQGSTTKQVVCKILLGKNEDTEYIPEISEEIYDEYAGGRLVLGMIELEEQRGKCIQQLRNQINERFPDALLYIQNKELLILFAYVDESKYADICAELGKMLENSRFLCGISEIFDTRGLIGMKKKMLKRIIRIGRQSEEKHHIFTEFQYYLELVCSYAYDEIGDKGYCFRDLERLEVEDREKGTEFYRTLKEYLLSGNSVNLAAKKMFIHRNTMVYRLSKIHEIMKQDINNPEISKRLLISMILRSFSRQENR